MANNFWTNAGAANDPKRGFRFRVMILGDVKLQGFHVTAFRGVGGLRHGWLTSAYVPLPPAPLLLPPSPTSAKGTA